MRGNDNTSTLGGQFYTSGHARRRLRRRWFRPAYSSARNAVPKLPAIADRHAYLDRVQIWLQVPLSHRQLRKLGRLCGGSATARREAMPYQPTWCQRLNLYQPMPEAFSLLEELRGDAYLVNYVELAVDYILADAQAAEHLVDYLRQHVVRLWPGKRHANDYEGTSYWAERRSTARNFALYRPVASKATGEVNCVHLEARRSTADRIRKDGLATLSALASVDFRAFFAKNLVLCAVDPGRLGLAFHRAYGDTKRVRPNGEDRRAGYLIVRAAQRNPDNWNSPPVGTAEDVLWHVRHRLPKIRRDRFLVKLDNGPLLP